MAKRLFYPWIAAVLAAWLLAQVFFTGAQTSEVAGNLAFALLILCVPSSALAYPLALAATALFESRGLFPYNSRVVLSVWWAVFFGCGLLQWALVFRLVNRSKRRPLT